MRGMQRKGRQRGRGRRWRVGMLKAILGCAVLSVAAGLAFFYARDAAAGVEASRAVRAVVLTKDGVC